MSLPFSMSFSLMRTKVSSSRWGTMIRCGVQRPQQLHQFFCQQHRRWMGHTVRIIVQQDLPDGKAYAGDIMDVKAGYARNFLIPKKMALYATRQNFKRLGIEDPQRETVEARQARREREALASDDKDLKAADLLRYYLRNKVLKIWRHVAEGTDTTSPGMVDAASVRKKLSKQLMIDLEPGERIHLKAEPVGTASHESELSEEELLFREFENVNVQEPCKVQIRQLGEHLARISLKGGHVVPLTIDILKR